MYADREAVYELFNSMKNAIDDDKQKYNVDSDFYKLSIDFLYDNNNIISIDMKKYIRPTLRFNKLFTRVNNILMNNGEPNNLLIKLSRGESKFNVS